MDALYALAETDLPAAFAEVKRQYANGRWEELQDVLAAHVLEQDFSKAEAVCGLLTDLMMQVVLQRAVPRAFRRDRAGTTMVVLGQLSGRAQGYAARYMVGIQLADGHLLAAMQTLASLPESPARRDIVSDIARKIGNADLSAGLRWMEELPSLDERSSARDAIGSNLSEARDADGLTQLLAVTAPDEPPKSGPVRFLNRSSLIWRIASLRQQSGDKTSLDALRAMLPDEEKEFVDVALLCADQDQPLPDRFARAAAFINPSARYEAITEVIRSEAAQDPQRAADFVMRSPEATFPTALKALGNAWKSKDGTAYANWVRLLPAGPRRENAIAWFVLQHQGTRAEKDLAREFAELAADESSREKLRREIGP